ncbi:hypothetical protein CC86DRAFT_408620 [Ophiobolus disseminans]|uniref:Uncharacterized protein n=1 Tax=Ophiobolus disseminans TaxID=1469910 RepID=A0A6A6ZUR2_9PLEO|nr:hypothetical protein CC86DRAFT_408620 [Ophiobolus disseminans]
MSRKLYNALPSLTDHPFITPVLSNHPYPPPQQQQLHEMHLPLLSTSLLLLLSTLALSAPTPDVDAQEGCWLNICFKSPPTCPVGWFGAPTTGLLCWTCCKI